ncbi:MAG TPA: EFR1 family ferrodoxin [Lachnospiraceae bacterium]|nr:EFR1 family ferrodoxin [Lachnospiraceae bacterium]
MKGLIFYFSGTGTTKLAVEYIAANLHNIDFDIHDMNDSSIPDLRQYELLGFASYAQAFNPPEYVENYIKNLSGTEKKYAFVFNTFGLLNGNTLNSLAMWVKSIGCHVIESFALHTPESSPIMIQYKITSENSPNDMEMQKFMNFIRELDHKIRKINSGEVIQEIDIKRNKLFSVLGKSLSKNSLSNIGKKFVNQDKCIKCKLCMKKCPYNAVYFEDEYPKFDETKCRSCFICYNVCPTQAIYSKKYTSIRYRTPNNKIVSKLKAKNTQ